MNENANKAAQTEAAEVQLLDTRPQSVSALQRYGLFTLASLTAGAATVPIEIAWHRALGPPLDVGQYLRHHVPIHMLKSLVRFSIFDVTRRQLEQNAHDLVPLPLRNAIAGSLGGLSEVAAQSLVERKLLPRQAYVMQAGRLFFGFGTNTALCVQLAPGKIPVEPFALSWGIAATSGALGSAAFALIDGFRGRQVALQSAKGFFIIGTIISVQLETFDRLMKRAAARDV